MISPLVIMPATAFGGFMANLSLMSPAISWISYLSPVRFAFEALLWAQWPDNERGVQTLLGFDLGYTKCCVALFVQSILYRILTLAMMKVMVKNGFR